ncbi:hypothetical protein AB0D11_45670 [Streptomyces monashensis]|uniref:hypothetical protein n=1 Tax=Streptomyces monashensis TaxID=1678012 RepID=UPI0033DCCD23
MYFHPAGPRRSRAPRNEHERVHWEGSKLVVNDTPGSSVLTLRSGTDRAIFVGDMLHSPVQVLEPAWNSRFCDDLQLAAKTRTPSLSRAAELRELDILAHWPGHGAAEVRQDHDGFAITKWGAFPCG